MTSRDPISKRIKEVRLQRGLSQAQLAHPELSDSYISLIESGSRKPTPAVLELLATKLGCSVSYLVNGIAAEEVEELELSLRYARLALENGEKAEARQRFSELLADHRLASLPSLHREAEYGSALSAEACGDLNEAISILHGLEDAPENELPKERRIAIAVALTRCYQNKGDLGKAIEVGERAMAEMTEGGWTDDLVELGATLLAAYYERGDLLRAQHFATELMAAADALGTPRAIVAANWNAASAADLAGRGQEAIPLVERALAVQSETGELRNLARLRIEYALIRLRNRPDDAATCRDLLLRSERELRESAASTLDLARCLQFLAMAELNLGHPEQAAEHAKQSISLLDDDAIDLLADTQVILGQAYLLLGQSDEAAAAVNAAIELLDQEPATRLTAESWFTAAAVLEEAGDLESSTFAYKRAMECSGL